MSTDPLILNTLLDAGTGMDEPVNQVPPEPKYNNGHMTVRWSPGSGKLALALSQAQLNFKPVKKQVENAFYSTDRKKAMYADLAAIMEGTQKALAEKELVVFQAPITDAVKRMAGVCSRLCHSSGEWYECELLLPATGRTKRWKDGVQVDADKFDAQTISIAVTYSRRITYQCAIGVAAEEDDDANSIGEASGGSHEAQKAVAERKIKTAVESGKTAALFYSFDDAAQTAYITGDVKLMGDNKELLLFKGKWDKKANAVVTDANGLEDLKYELEQRGVIFRPLKGTEVTAALQESIAQAKAKKGDAQ